MFGFEVSGQGRSFRAAAKARKGTFCFGFPPLADFTAGFLVAVPSACEGLGLVTEHPNKIAVCPCDVVASHMRNFQDMTRDANGM